MSEEKQSGTPDWTVWLRSRLERLASSEGKEDGAEPPLDAALDPFLPPRPSAPVEDPAPPEVEVTAGGEVVPASFSESPQQDAALPTGPDPGVVAGLDALRSAVAALPTGPDPGVVAGLEALRSAVAALPTGPDPGVVAGLEALRSATTALSIRVEALADANSSFRSVLNERLDEYAETVLRVVKGTTSNLDEYRRMHATSITELRRTGAETAGSLARLAGRMEELATIQGDDERWVEVMGQLCDEVTAERAWGRSHEEVRAEEAVSSSERLGAVEEVLDRLAAQVAGLAARVQVAQEQPRREHSFGETELQTLAAAVAEALAERLPLAPPVPRASPAPAARATAKRAAKKRTTGTSAPPRPTSNSGAPRRKTPIRVREPADPAD